MYLKIRHIPFALKIKIIFGSVATLIGLIFLTFGLIFSSIFLSMSDFSDWRFTKDSPRAKAVITQTEIAFATEQGKTITAYHYEFTDLQGIKQKGISYGTDQIYQVGDEARVIFLEKNPEYSRIENLKRKPFGKYVLLTLLFPLIGLLMILLTLPKSLKELHILREGVLGEARFVEMQSTNIEVNRKPLMKLFFELNVANKTYRVSTQTHREAVIRKLSDGTPQKLLYLPQDPHQVVFIENIIGKPTFRTDGSIAEYPLFPAVLYLLFPIVCLIVLGKIFS